MAKRASKRVISIPVFVLFAFTLMSCIQTSPKLSEKSFITKVGAPIEDFLDITILSSTPVHIGQTIFLDAKNKTDECVDFPFDLGLKIFAYQNNDWIQIPYKGKFASNADVIMEPKGKPFPDESLFVDPDYSKLQLISVQQRIRIVLMGKPCINGSPSQQEQADFVELSIQP